MHPALGVENLLISQKEKSQLELPLIHGLACSQWETMGKILLQIILHLGKKGALTQGCCQTSTQSPDRLLRFALKPLKF